MHVLAILDSIFSSKVEGQESRHYRQDDAPDFAQTAGVNGVVRQAANDAVAAYGWLGLPIHRGEYCRPPGTSEWLWIADKLTPEEKWNLLEDRPVSSGWAYCTFSELGRHDTDSTVANLASEILVACDRLNSRGDSSPDETVEVAIQLGINWQKLMSMDPELRLVNSTIALAEHEHLQHRTSTSSGHTEQSS